ncbi:MAG: ETC complex I subunit [Alphaproteobacteria bacterium]|nr:ETC complex I subunit [Alphaproteobacteria bacterium]MDA8006571.1 ETC complex I subunit [Alphaproteobacteria bacterium]MDA8013983.1 ETC complex I subunit [Alphaproteobacteria bacterium]
MAKKATSEGFAMEVRIYRSGKSVMQSGRAGSERVVVEFAPEAGLVNNDLTGWATMRDTRRQMRLTFESEERAIAWARERGYAYSVGGMRERVVRTRSYDDNFSHRRRLPWTH